MSTPISSQVLIAIASAGARQAVRATVMAMGLPPVDPRAGQPVLESIVRFLRENPTHVVVLDLAALGPSPPHLLSLVKQLPESALRGRIILTREDAGLWANEQAWVTELGFAGLWADLGPQALSQAGDPLVATLARLAGVAPLPGEKLMQYFSAMKVQADANTPRARIRRLTGLSAQDLCKAMASNVKATDRVYRFRNYPSCYTGVEAVDWLSERFALSREQAVTLGLDLQALKLLQHVVHEQPFADKPNFYRSTLASVLDRRHPGTALEMMRQPAGVEVADRTYLGKVYPSCFVGADAIGWASERLTLRRHEAEILFNRLMAFGLIRHVTDEHPVRDGNFYYRFID